MDKKAARAVAAAKLEASGDYQPTDDEVAGRRQVLGARYDILTTQWSTVVAHVGSFVEEYPDPDRQGEGARTSLALPFGTIALEESGAQREMFVVATTTHGVSGQPVEAILQYYAVPAAGPSDNTAMLRTWNGQEVSGFLVGYERTVSAAALPLAMPADLSPETLGTLETKASSLAPMIVGLEIVAHELAYQEWQQQSKQAQTTS